MILPKLHTLLRGLMKKIFFLIFLISLTSCGEEFQAQNDKPKVRIELPSLEFDYDLPNRNIPIEIYEFQKIDFGLDLS
jgi:hypothetical protein